METPKPPDNDFFRGLFNALPLALLMWAVAYILARAFYGDIISWFTKR